MMMKVEKNNEEMEKWRTEDGNQLKRVDSFPPPQTPATWVNSPFKLYTLTYKFRHFILYTSSLILLYFLAYSCANPLAPTGGPRDETPPSVVEEESSPNFQTSFEKQRIELTFDEWVQVNDIFQQVVVSPPLEKPLDITLKKKTVRVDFADEEELKKDVTYTINFGEAVKDLTEKNPAENLRFVFSTGDYLDSLTISGQVLDAFTAEPKKDIRVMLYENLSDTVVRTERPFYFAKTDEEGNFKIENVKEGTFKGFALEDSDLNYLFNQSNEAIGFPDSFIVLKPDTNAVIMDIQLFTEAQAYRIQDVDSTIYGLLKVNFNQNPSIDLLSIRYDTIGQEVLYEFDRDTLKVWYDQSDRQNWSLYLQQDSIFSDTIPIRPGDRSAFLAESNFQAKGGGTGRKFKPTLDVVVNFNHPIAEIDTALIGFYEDTLRTKIQPIYSFDTLAKQQLSMAYSWREGRPYELEILPGAITDMYGLVNQDSIVKTFSPSLYKNFGNLNLTLVGFDSTLQYVVELLGRNDAVAHQWILSGSESYNRLLNTISPAKYTVQVITDYNQNGRWDTGDYDLELQPEPIYRRPIDEVRANWDVEATVTLGEKLPEPEKPEAKTGTGRNSRGGQSRGGRRGN